MTSLKFFDAIATNGLDLNCNDLIHSCLARFDNDGDCALNLREFSSLANQLFTDAYGHSYSLPARMLGEMFFALDLDKDGKINEDEFERVWKSWVVPIVKPKSALIVIDVQNDFIDGSLAVRNCPAQQEGLEVVPLINDLLKSVPFDNVFYTYDWHPDDHVSFIDNAHLRKFHESSLVSAEEVQVFDTVVFEGPPEIEQKLWPRHCVQKSWGSELHPDLDIVDEAIFIYKGTCSDIDSYSAFWDNQKRSQTNLVNELKDRNITDVFVCGLAYDYCVGYTALHALEHGYRTILVGDACRGVSCDDISNMQEKLISEHGIVVTTDKVKEMVSGKDRRPELGYRTAMVSSISN